MAIRDQSRTYFGVIEEPQGVQYNIIIVAFDVMRTKETKIAIFDDPTVI